MRPSLSIVLALGLVFPAVAFATSDKPEAEKAARYPYDPVCPWGRLSNGKGMLHRCISEGEARTLASEVKKDAAEKKDSASDKAEKPGSEKATSKKSDEKSSPKSYDLSVGPIAAEQGEITVGRLDVPLDRYRACIDENGGLKAASGTVVVKFLVRAERVRAEGASVDSFQNVSSRAAECIASVVDRRQVGAPSVPMTGATLSFSLREKK